MARRCLILPRLYFIGPAIAISFVVAESLDDSVPLGLDLAFLLVPKLEPLGVFFSPL